MLADVVRGHVGIELADGAEADITHDRVAELGGEDIEACGRGWVVVAGENLSEHLAAKTGKVRGITSRVGASNSLPADDVEGAGGDVVRTAESVLASIFVERAGEQPGREVGIVGFVEEAPPRVGVKAIDTLSERSVGVHALGRQGSKTEEDEGGVVEGLVIGDCEVVLPTGGRWFGTAGDSAEVRHQAEDALWLPSFERDRIAGCV